MRQVLDDFRARLVPLTSFKGPNKARQTFNETKTQLDQILDRKYYCSGTTIDDGSS